MKAAAKKTTKKPRRNPLAPERISALLEQLASLREGRSMRGARFVCALALARDGEVVLAKLDTDANQMLAQAFQIRGIPAVKAFKDRRLADEFVGVKPPAEVASSGSGCLGSCPGVGGAGRRVLP